jgi:capsular exopolysaccharide synthesis family protein
MPEFTGHKDLRTYLRVIWRWKWLVVVLVVGAPVVAYLVERGKPEIYKSSALVGVSQTTVDTSVLGASSSGSFSTSNVTAIADLVTTTPVAEIAAGLMHPPTDASAIAGKVSASGDPATNFLTISAEDTSPVQSRQIANAFAKAISLNRQQAAISQLRDAIVGVNAQIARAGTKNTANRIALEGQLNQLKAAVSTQGSDAAILQPAGYGAAVGPDLKRTVLLGLIIGILLAAGAIVLAENADRRLRTPDDLEGMTDLPLLASIAPSAFSGQLDTREEDEEAFNMLRTAVTYLNIDRPLDSLVVTSPGEKDGKTTVATRLALVMARAGMTVILVDADLRRAQVSAKLGIQQRAGLGSVIAREHTLSEALVSYPIGEIGAGQLSVLPAGPLPPNPSALMSSDEMQRTLRDLEAQSDIVIIDTPAALAVSDPLPLMGSVSGVVLVARMNNSTRETIRRLQRMIVSAHGQLLGVVATGVASGPGYEGYTPKAYTHDGGSASGGRRGLRRKSRAQDAGGVAAAERD